MSQYNRSINLDVTRGLAIVFMACFHFAYYLCNLFHWDFNYNDPKIYLSRLLIMTLFLGCAGISLALQAQRGYNWNSFLKRMALLGGCSVGIGIATYLFAPGNWIYFGILQFLFVATLVGVLFSYSPKVSLVLGIIIIAGHFFVIGWLFPSMSQKLISFYHIHNLQYYFSFQFLFNFLQPYLDLPSKTLDIAYFIPWFGLVLIGIFIGHQHYKLPSVPQNSLFKTLAFLGRHSLPLYFIHAIVLAFIALVIEWIVNGDSSTVMQLLHKLL